MIEYKITKEAQPHIAIGNFDDGVDDGILCFEYTPLAIAIKRPRMLMDLVRMLNYDGVNINDLYVEETENGHSYIPTDYFMKMLHNAGIEERRSTDTIELLTKAAELLTHLDDGTFDGHHLIKDIKQHIEALKKAPKPWRRSQPPGAE